jgi:hypothetical protein
MRLSIDDVADFYGRIFALANDFVISWRQLEGRVFFVHDRNSSLSVHRKEQAFTEVEKVGTVKVRFGDAVSVAGRFAFEDAA